MENNFGSSSLLCLHLVGYNECPCSGEEQGYRRGELPLPQRRALEHAESQTLNTLNSHCDMHMDDCAVQGNGTLLSTPIL